MNTGLAKRNAVIRSLIFMLVANQQLKAVVKAAC